MTHPDNRAELDPARTINLPGTPWRAAVTICADGSEMLWLVSPDPGQQSGCACGKCAPHEQDTTPDRKERAT